MQSRIHVGTHPLWKGTRLCLNCPWRNSGLKIFEPQSVEMETNKKFKSWFIKNANGQILDPEILMLGIYSREIITSLHKSISIIVTAAFKINKTHSLVTVT